MGVDASRLSQAVRQAGSQGTVSVNAILRWLDRRRGSLGGDGFTSSQKHGLPVTATRLNRQVLDQEPDDVAEGNVSRWQMRLCHQRVESNFCASAQVQMRWLEESSASGMPVIGQDFPTLTVIYDIAVSHDLDVMRRALSFMPANTKIWLHVQHQLMSAGKRDGLSIRQFQVVRGTGGIVIITTCNLDD